MDNCFALLCFRVKELNYASAHQHCLGMFGYSTLRCGIKHCNNCN
jgi:hypothetical protein